MHRLESDPATLAAGAGTDGGGGIKRRNILKNRLIAFLAHVLDSPLRGRANRPWEENQKCGQEKRLSDGGGIITYI